MMRCRGCEVMMRWMDRNYLIGPPQDRLRVTADRGGRTRGDGIEEESR